MTRHAHIILALTATAALTLTACGSSEDTLPPNERAYLNAVYDAASSKGSGIKGYGDRKNLDLGQQVCDRLDEGHTPEAAIASLEQDPARGVSEVAPDIVNAAQTHLCPPE